MLGIRAPCKIACTALHCTAYICVTYMGSMLARWDHAAFDLFFHRSHALASSNILILQQPLHAPAACIEHVNGGSSY